MIDYVLVNKRFCTSVLDTHVYRLTLHESDHELVLSTLCFKIKAKCRQTSATRYQTTNLPYPYLVSYQSALAESLNDHLSTVTSPWDTFKTSIQKTCESLPPAPRTSDPDWVTDKVRNLSCKKQEAWIHLKNAPSQDISQLKLEYNHLKRLTKIAAENACSHWWSECAAEVECQALIAEQQGKGGSLIRDLHLLKKKFSKPGSSTLVAKDASTLQRDGDKLNRWAEYFKEVVNCQVDVDVSLDDLSIVPLSPASSDTPLSDEEIHTAISKLTSGRTTGQDGITLEMLSLGWDVTVRWLKAIFDTIWATESFPEDWQSQLLVPLQVGPSVTTTEVLLS